MKGAGHNDCSSTMQCRLCFRGFAVHRSIRRVLSMSDVFFGVGRTLAKKTLASSRMRLYLQARKYACCVYIRMTKKAQAWLGSKSTAPSGNLRVRLHELRRHLVFSRMHKNYGRVLLSQVFSSSLEGSYNGRGPADCCI